MSISKSQAQALASGFLNNVGEAKGELVLRETLPELFLLAGEFIESAQDNLNSSNSIASGALSKSLVAHEPQQTGTSIKVDIEMVYYGQFVNKGVRGTRGGAGLYSFKNDFPSRKMIKSLMASIGRAKSSTFNVHPRKTPFKTERKNVNTALSKAWGAAVNIKRYGIKATGFLDKAILTTEAKVQDRFSKAFEIDILNSLPDRL